MGPRRRQGEGPEGPVGEGERRFESLRSRYERAKGWLDLIGELPAIVVSEPDVHGICEEFASRLTSVRGIASAAFFEAVAGQLRPLGASRRSAHPLTREAAALLGDSRAGLCNDPIDDAQRSLSEAVGLVRFLWYRVEIPTRDPVVVFAGCGASQLGDHDPFDDQDIEHFKVAVRQFELSLQDLLLVAELENNVAVLNQFNATLQQRIEARTGELAEANRELESALFTLQEKDRSLSEDLQQARSFQQSVLARLPSDGPLEFGSVYMPLDVVGGDIYDVALLAPEHYRVFVADATGHGVQASLSTIAIKSEYDRLKADHPTPESVLGELNRNLVRRFPAFETLCTACCFDFRLTAGGARLRSASAGHPPLVRVSSSGAEEITAEGAFLGASARLEFKATECFVASGDLVVAYTDGLCDQAGPQGTTFSLLSAMEHTTMAERRVSDLLMDVMRRFQEHRGAIKVYDDVTVIAARIRPDGRTMTATSGAGR